MTVFRCHACGFVFGRPREEKTAIEHYEGYYQGSIPPAPVARYAEWLGRAEATVGVGRLLEVGAGSGGFVRAALDRGWTVDATEVSRSGIEILTKTGARVHAGNVEDAGYPDGVFDAVFAVEVLEHLPKPAAHLRELQRITRPGGLLVLTTPNFNGLSRRVFGLRWRAVEPEHLCYFTTGTLTRALREAGFSRVRIRSRALDVSTWMRQVRAAREGPVLFDPHASARLRDEVEASTSLRFVRELINHGLGLTGLGDSLVAWARR